MIVPASTTNKPIITLPKRGALIRSAKTCLNAGYLTFGEDDKYPDAVYNLIMASKTALSAARISADFTFGDGFENPEIGNIEISKNNFGQKITVNDLAKACAFDLAFFNGFYAKCVRLGDYIETVYKPDFKKVRIGIPDDLQSISTMVVGVIRNKKLIYEPYYTFTDSQDVRVDRFKKNKSTSIPEIYTAFLNDENIYPLSPIEAVALDCSNEALLSLLQNNALRNGLTDKTIVLYKKQTDSVDSAGNILPTPIEIAVQGMLGADGDSIIAMECESRLDGEMIEDVKVLNIPTNIKNDLTKGWGEDASNAIRMQYDGLPQNILDAGLKSGITSESGKQLQISYEIYNKATKYRRDFLSKCIAEIMAHHSNEIIRLNDNWNLLDKKLDLTTI